MEKCKEDSSSVPIPHAFISSFDWFSSDRIFNIIGNPFVFEMTVFFKVLAIIFKKYKFIFAGLQTFATAYLGRS